MPIPSLESSREGIFRMQPANPFSAAGQDLSSPAVSMQPPVQQPAGPPPRNLFAAVEASDPYTIRLLLRMGTSPDQTDEVGRSPLFMAAMIGYHGSVQVLLEHKANPNSVTVSGMTPLMAAAMRNHLLVAEMLVDAGASVEQADQGGATALDMAMQEGHAEMVALLVSLGANPNRPGADGFPPLIAAINSYQSQMAQALIRASADVFAKDANGESALHWAVRMGDLMTLNMLMDRGINPDEPACPAGDTPLMQAVFQGSAHMVQVLLDRGANPDVRNADGLSALMLLASEPEADEFEGERTPRPGMQECMAALLSARPDVDATDEAGYTALMMAAVHGNEGFARQLLAAGASRTLKNGKKHNAQAVAKAHGHKGMVKLLQPESPLSQLLAKFAKKR